MRVGNSSAENWSSWSLGQRMGPQPAGRSGVQTVGAPVPAVAISAMPGWLKSHSRKDAGRPHSERMDPLYLFFCSAQWHRDGDNTAGWELIHGLRSWDRGVRAVAAALLAKTEKSRLLVRDLRRTRSGLDVIAAEYALKPTGQSPDKVVTMNTPYGLEMYR